MIEQTNRSRTGCAEQIDLDENPKKLKELLHDSSFREGYCNGNPLKQIWSGLKIPATVELPQEWDSIVVGHSFRS
jgi:hypothetical protein